MLTTSYFGLRHAKTDAARTSHRSFPKKVGLMKTRHILGDYAVDLYPANGRVYYTVIRQGSADLLSIGDQPTEEEALQQAEWTIREFGSVKKSAQSA
jgi:hypothetical protein